ncbi:MAG: hypothetical protein DMD35_15260 [Gemmatimonadetes bacterium]|nr:MAG: hypothetical protein DMD35_15260 [Gemmatimonadota bacterium]
MRRLFAVLALASLVACSENSTTAPVTVNLIGTWRLQTVNGSPLTYTQTTANGTLEVFSGAIVIDESGNFTTTLSQRLTATNGSSSILVVTTYGTVEISGPNIVFHRTDIANDPGTTAELTATTISLTQNGLVLVFAKT